MEKVIKNGFAERVPPVKVESSGKAGPSCYEERRAWYITHHGVYLPKKPTKIRVVFDCSAEFQNESLNKHLLQVPDLTNNLVGVLCRFSREPVALMCNIEGMFHQVRVAEQNRDLLRFLWFRMTRHLFGATSSPGCANFALKMATHDETDKDFYVDDGLTSMKSVHDAVTLIKDKKEMCRRGGFKLHKITSSHKEVIEAIPIED